MRALTLYLGLFYYPFQFKIGTCSPGESEDEDQVCSRLVVINARYQRRARHEGKQPSWFVSQMKSAFRLRIFIVLFLF